MQHLRALENQSIYILREAYKHFRELAMLWSMGKDSTVLLWLARKAFFGHMPFPLVHIDTGYEMPELLAYRDRLCREWRFNLVVGQNQKALASGMNHTIGRVACCTALKIEALQATLTRHGWTAVILGIRADEEGTRAKERYFSPRDKMESGIFATSHLKFGINIRRPSLPRPISASIPCWTGPNSTFGSISNSNTSRCPSCTLTAAMGPVTAVLGACPVPEWCRLRPPRFLRSSVSCGRQPLLNVPAEHRMRAGAWNSSGSAVTCSWCLSL